MEVIILASDHAAFEAKEDVKKYLASRYEVIDLGPKTADRCDYSQYAIDLCRKIQKEKCRGILLCGSGIGMSMAANRFSGIRAALCRTAEEAKLSVEHNNANVLCLGGRISSTSEIREMIDAWFKSKFEGSRHIGRIDLFNDLGEK